MRTVPKSGPSVIELTDKQVQYLIGVGLFIRMKSGTPIGPMMKIFLVPEHHKRRFRLTIHTVDINQADDRYTANVNFEEPQEMLQFHKETAHYVAQNDAAAYYHQFAPPPLQGAGLDGEGPVGRTGRR